MTIVKNFTLDFSGQSGVPSQWGITLPNVLDLFSKQLKNVEGIQLVEDWRRRGVFEVTAFTQEAVTRLTNFKVKITKEKRSFEIPLKEKSNGKKAVWVTINGTKFGKMATVPNAYFDGVLKENGATIKVETKRRHYRGYKYYNGQREALVELGDAHIQRQHCYTDEDGKEHNWWLMYRGQPHSCRRCDDQWHEDGNCPKWQAKRQEEANEGQQKLLVYSTSFLRHAKDSKTARYDCVPGAQIGHIGNHIDNDATILPQAEVVVVAAGQNMSGDVLEATKEKVKEQGKVLVRALKEYSEEKKVYLVDPVIGQIGQVEEDEEDDEWRFLRAEMRRMASEAGGKFVPMDTLVLNDDDMTADGVHLTETGTRRYLTIIRNFITNDTGKDYFGDILTSSREYAGQRLRHWKVGCAKCTFLHQGQACPTRKSDDDDNDKADGDDDDEEEDDDTTKVKQVENKDDDDEADRNDISLRSREKRRKSLQQHSDAEEASPEATLDLTAAASAAPSFAAAVASTPSRQLPANPETRTRSTSSKRGSDGEPTRSDSLKRQKKESELDQAIKRNRESLINSGMDGSKQDSLWKGIKGVQLYNRQNSMLEKVATIPNMKKGGKK